MDVLVMLEDHPDHSPVLAHVNSGPAPLYSERPPRDVVTLYGSPSPESLALALAAAVESRRLQDDRGDVIRHLGLWPERGAVGDADVALAQERPTVMLWGDRHPFPAVGVEGEHRSSPTAQVDVGAGHPHRVALDMSDLD